MSQRGPHTPKPSISITATKDSENTTKSDSKTSQFNPVEPRPSFAHNELQANMAKHSLPASKRDRDLQPVLPKKQSVEAILKQSSSKHGPAEQRSLDKVPSVEVNDSQPNNCSL